MAKSKSSSKAVKAEAPPAALKSVKAGRVTKPAEDSKKSKATAKTAVKAHQKSEKKRKDSVKSDSDSDSDATSDSSASSAGESDDEMSVDEKPAAKVNGAKKAAKKAESSDSDSSESEAESEVEAPKVKTNGASKAAAKDDSSDSSDDSESDEEEKPVTNGAKAAKKEAVKADSSDDSDASSSDEEMAETAAVKAGAEDDDSEADSDSDSSSEEEEEKPAKKAPEQKKRKAETETTKPVKRVKHNGEPLSEPSKNLFVGSLSWNVDEDWLSREFEGFGNIVGVRIITDRDSGRSKGFGYVEFEDVESATAALDAKQGAQVDGREINIDFGKVRPDRSYNNDQVSARAQKFGDRAPNEPSNTVFVGNISFNADQDMITEAFSEYGTVNGVRLPTDPDSGNMKGFGYVEFGSIEEAQAAVEALNGADIAGRNIRLDFAGARPATGDSPRGGRGRGGFGGGRGRGGFDRGGRGGGRGRGGFDRGGRGGGRGGFSTNRGGFGDFKGKKISF